MWDEETQVLFFVFCVMCLFCFLALWWVGVFD